MAIANPCFVFDRNVALMPRFCLVSTDIENQVSQSSKVTFLKQSLVAEELGPTWQRGRVVVGFYFPE